MEEEGFGSENADYSNFKNHQSEINSYDFTSSQFPPLPPTLRFNFH